MPAPALGLIIGLIIVDLIVLGSAYYLLSTPAGSVVPVSASAGSAVPVSASAGSAPAGTEWQISPNTNAHYGLSPAQHINYGGASTPEDCQKVCAFNKECLAFSLTPAGTCWGRNAAAPPAWVSPAPGYTSGRRVL